MAARVLANWVKKHYPDSKRDLCACFIERGFTLVKPEGYSAMVTMQSWMFLGSFEAVREKMLKERFIASMAHLGTRAFDAIGGEVVATTATVFGNGPSGDPASYLLLVDFDGEASKEGAIREAIANSSCGWFYRCSFDSFKSIPGTPRAYWASDALLKVFEAATPLSKIGVLSQGLGTGENARFVRQWWEVAQDRSQYDCGSIDESVESGCRWFPYNKGGDYRRWYGNNDCVVNWENDGREIRGFASADGKQLSRPQNTQCYLKPSIIWSKISSGSIAFRYKPQGHVFDVAGTSIFTAEDELLYLQGACNSSVMLDIASMLSPTLNFEMGQIATYPILIEPSMENRVLELVGKVRDLSQADWDSVEASWVFGRHPMV